MLHRPLGKTGLSVSEIGLGGGTGLGNPTLPGKQAEAVLNQALDLGITFIDTAAMYGDCEARIGEFISHRRDEYTLATKCGDYSVTENGTRRVVKDYTPDGILRTIDTSRKKLNMDVIDIVQFHGLPGDADDTEAAFEALLEAKHRGWTRFVGISQDGPGGARAAAEWPLDTQEFTYNFLYQEADEILFPILRDRQMGAIVKRPITNAIWQLDEKPDRAMMAGPWERVQTFPLAELAGDMPLIEFALRFTLSHPDVSTAIVGTTNPDHLADNVRISDGRKLSDDLLQRTRQAFHDRYGA